MFSFFILVLLLNSLNVCLGASQKFNNRPIIGVLAQEATHKQSLSEISASVVKFLEASGARVVPIFINRDYLYYEKMFNYTNGVFFPGGDLTPDQNFLKTGYARAGKAMFDLAIKANKRGDYYPIWGTCLGLELLSILAADLKNWLQRCHADDDPLKLDFLMNRKHLKRTKMFEHAEDNVIEILASRKVTYNYHDYCLTPANFSRSGLDRYFTAISTSTDLRNNTFISAIEANDYPFYAIHFHPEIVMYEFVKTPDENRVPHDFRAIYVAQYFTRFFVNETRKNFHHFPSEREEKLSLIYNYNPTYTGLENEREQTYYFPLN
ncbi:gamma-glutamyl hydrolase-like isoform X1 [Dinothrombium tinctorium]|uniref:folate gamma-glutamyl hydrolase n=1 Tax=Dinothrombium tinctorium TaxID=1965070 RepID=A0A3S3QIW0_9ACAR|nr:gamma-glutamyl hydrolase-like isoform X1 [Dinothrombium tinctorium]